RVLIFVDEALDGLSECCIAGLAERASGLEKAEVGAGIARRNETEGGALTMAIAIERFLGDRTSLAAGLPCGQLGKGPFAVTVGRLDLDIFDQRPGRLFPPQHDVVAGLALQLDEIGRYEHVERKPR